ncbi:MAG: hypothetical protein M5U12_13165 [Verrucomicrobia bacterium]|nr:hypothetical protein [Verrucomicrobiota bacterium]
MGISTNRLKQVTADAVQRAPDYVRGKQIQREDVTFAEQAVAPAWS